MSVIMFISHFWLYHLITMFSLVNWQLNIGLLQFFWPVRTSPARCGRSGGSGWVWLCNQSVRSSYRLRLQPMLLPPPLPLQTRPLSPARTRPPPAACCPIASAGHREAPPPERHGYSTLERNKQEVIPTARYPWIHWPCVPMCILSTLYALNSIENY